MPMYLVQKAVDTHNFNENSQLLCMGCTLIDVMFMLLISERFLCCCVVLRYSKIID